MTKAGSVIWDAIGSTAVKYQDMRAARRLTEHTHDDLIQEVMDRIDPADAMEILDWLLFMQVDNNLSWGIMDECEHGTYDAIGEASKVLRDEVVRQDNVNSALRFLIGQELRSEALAKVYRELGPVCAA